MYNTIELSVDSTHVTFKPEKDDTHEEVTAPLKGLMLIKGKDGINSVSNNFIQFWSISEETYEELKDALMGISLEEY